MLWALPIRAETEALGAFAAVRCTTAASEVPRRLCAGLVAVVVCGALCGLLWWPVGVYSGLLWSVVVWWSV